MDFNLGGYSSYTAIKLGYSELTSESNNNSSSFVFTAKSTDFFDYEDAEYVTVEYGN